MNSKLSLLLGVVVSSALGQSKITNPKETGNCVSGTIAFNAERAYNMKSSVDQINPEDHDVAIEYGATNTQVCPLTIFETDDGF